MTEYALILSGTFLFGLFIGTFFGEHIAEKRRAEEEAAAAWMNQLEQMGVTNEQSDES